MPAQSTARGDLNFYIFSRVQQGSAPLGAAENSPARPSAPGAEGKCRVQVAQTED